MFMNIFINSGGTWRKAYCEKSNIWAVIPQALDPSALWGSSRTHPPTSNSAPSPSDKPWQIIIRKITSSKSPLYERYTTCPLENHQKKAKKSVSQLEFKPRFKRLSAWEGVKLLFGKCLFPNRLPFVCLSIYPWCAWHCVQLCICCIFCSIGFSNCHHWLLTSVHTSNFINLILLLNFFFQKKKKHTQKQLPLF